MKFDSPVTIIAPGSLHLPLYAGLHEKLGNTTQIQLLGLNGWLNLQTRQNIKGRLPLLYEYRRRLKDLNPDNSFYGSIADYDFLKDCLSFMEKYFLYGLKLEDLPEETAKDRDLKEIVERLAEVPILQSEVQIDQLDPELLKSIRILDLNYSLEERHIIDQMTARGARIIQSPDDLIEETDENKKKEGVPDTLSEKKQKRYYWSMSNPRTQMEVIADTIVRENLKAEEIYISLSRPEDASVLEQVFSARNIPLTLMSQPAVSPVLTQWKAVLNWLITPDPDHRIEMLKALYPASSVMVREYLKTFPDGSELQDLKWEENPVISENDFLNMQSMEAQMEPWQPVFERMNRWDFSEKSMADIAAAIQEANPTPDEDDLRVFEGVINAYSSVKDEIRSNEDLKLLIRYLDSLYPASALEEWKGVLAGTRREISPLFKTVFYTGADASHFPNYTLNSGIFDEAYMARLAPAYPDLARRLEIQRQGLFHSLEMPETLYVTVPQADYMGKSFETSYELFDWLNTFPKFQRWDDSSWSVSPDFSLSEDVSSQMFFHDRIYSPTLRSLDAFARCPLQHMLKYGMKLKTPFKASEHLQVRADIFRNILDSAPFWFSKPLWQLSEEEVRFLVARQFEFPRKVLPSQSDALQILENEYVMKIRELLSVLGPVTRDLGVSVIPADYRIELSEEIDGIQLEMDSVINSASQARTPITLVSDSRPDKPDSPDDRSAFHNAMAAMDISLKIKPVSEPAYTISMGRGKQQVQANPVTGEQTAQKFIQNFLKDSVRGQNVPESDNPEAEYIRKKTPSYSDVVDGARNKVENFLEDLKSGCALPLHKADACKFCAFKTICRNGAREATDENKAAAAVEAYRYKKKMEDAQSKKSDAEASPAALTKESSPAEDVIDVRFTERRDD